MKTKVWDENQNSGGGVTSSPGGYMDYEGPEIDFDVYWLSKFGRHENDIDFAGSLTTLMYSEAARGIPGIIGKIGTGIGVIGGVLGTIDNVYSSITAANNGNNAEAVYQRVQAAGYFAGTILLFVASPIGMGILLANSILDLGEYFIKNWGKEWIE